MPPEILRHRARCPRCGYDLHGALSTWRDACPLTGTCAECGLAFEWAELLSDTVRRPSWHVEHSHSVRRLAIQIPQTLLVSTLPGMFWSAVHMTHEIRWWRIAAYLLVLFAVPYLVFIIGHGHLAWLYWRDLNQQAGVTVNVSPVRTVVTAVALPLSSRSPGTVSELVRAPMCTSLVTGNAARASGPSSIVSAYPSSRGLFRFRIVGYAEPLTRRDWANYLMWIPRPFVEGHRDWLLPVQMAALALVYCGLCPMGFLALPISRRTAQVRWRHIVRIALYFLPILTLPLLYASIEFIRQENWTWDYDRFALRLRAWFMVVVPLAAAGWWAMASSRYLKLPHGWGIGAAVALMSLLVESLVMALYFLVALTGDGSEG